MPSAELGNTDETDLRRLVDTLRSRAERLDALDQLVASFKQETELHRGLADSLNRSLALVQQVVAEHEAFFTQSLDLLCIATTDGNFHKINRAFERALGYTQEELLSRPFFELVHPDDLEQTRQEVAKLSAGVDTLTFDNRYRHKDGSYRWLNWTTPAPAPGARYLYAVARDVTEQRQRQEHTLYLASHDALTGLVNRWRFDEELQASLARLKRDAGRTFAVLLLDLDHFKPVNDRHGHQAGDAVLRAVAARMSAIKRDSDVLCRLGGDEFALLAHDVDAAGAAEIAARMREQVVRRIDLGGIEVGVDVSIGIAHVAEGGDAAAVLGLADRAMYEAKRCKGDLLRAGAEVALASL
jgi:diguanylate cyclase (GGDEF)-like protein/PAS domain S-box-containing protein